VDTACRPCPWPLAALRRHQVGRAVAFWLLLLALAPATGPFATAHGTLAYAVAAIEASARVKEALELPMLVALPTVVGPMPDAWLASTRVGPRPVIRLVAYRWRGAQPDAHAVLRM
jgi:hypothetical protein